MKRLQFHVGYASKETYQLAMWLQSARGKAKDQKSYVHVYLHQVSLHGLECCTDHFSDGNEVDNAGRQLR